MNIKLNRYSFFFLLVFLFALVMVLASRIDYQWTILINSHEWKAFTDIMDRSLFEGDRLSPNDLVIFIFAGFVIMYVLASLVREDSSFYPWRPGLGFVVTSGLITGVGLVHSLKWVVGRVRPSDYLKHDLVYTEWFEFGAHFIESSHKGSFPSGHTAQAFMLMSVAYLLAGDPRHSRRMKLAGLIIGALVLGFALTMGFSRSMSFHHWISDWLGSIFLSWIIIHTLYYWVFRVPDQALQLLKGVPGRPSRFRELYFLAVVLVFILGFMTLLAGARSMLLSGIGWMGVLVLPGLAGIVLAWKLYRMWVSRGREEAVRDER
jgi:membrane-associated phospholipid phosphatase